MNDTTQTLLRSILKLGAGAMVAKGYTDDSTAEIIIAGMLALFGVAWGVAHRHQPKGPSGPLLTFLAVSILSAGFIAGCGTLDPAGVYRGDKVIYDAELTTRTAYDVIHTFVTWEKANRQQLAAMPAVRRYADYTRANAEQWIHTAVALRDAYAADPSAENADALQTALRVLREAVRQSTTYLVNSTSQPPTPP